MRDKRRRSRLTPKQTETLYVVGLLSMQEIAERAGITRQAVKEILDRQGIAYRGGKVERSCGRCGQAFEVARYRARDGEGVYCSPRCGGLARSGQEETMQERTERVLTEGRKV